MKQFTKWKQPVVAAFLMVLLLLLGNSNAFAIAYIPEVEVDISRSKTATDLDENYRSHVTLSLPAQEETLVSDVVFVVDSSSCARLAAQGFYDALTELSERVDGTGATVQVGVVLFRGSVEEFPLQTLTSDYVATLQEQIESPQVRGSNMHGGLLAAQKMLEGSSTPENRQYIVLISDGITYSWDQDGVQYAAAIQQYDTGRITYASNSDYEIVHGTLSWHPDNNDWETYLNSLSDKIAATLADKSEPYTRDTTAITKYIAQNEYDAYACSVDVALSKCLTVWNEMSGYHRYVMTQPSGQYGEYFLDSLDGEHGVSFDDIQNDIYYLLGTGTAVDDTVGQKFHILHDIDEITLTVGGEELSKTVDENGTIYFGYNGENYRYKLEFVVEEDGLEHFIWTAEEPISEFAPAQLTYTVELNDPETNPGTYGQEDLNGDGLIDGTNEEVDPDLALYTNESAILYPVDSNGMIYAPVPFPQPSVSYTIAAKYTVTYTDGVEDEDVFADQVTTDLAEGETTPAFDGTPTREGYTFKGWAPEVSETVTGDATYVAQWEKIPDEEEPKDIDKTEETKTKDSSAKQSPKTADQTDLTLLFGLLVVAMVAMFAIRRKQMNR